MTGSNLTWQAPRGLPAERPAPGPRWSRPAGVFDDDPDVDAEYAELRGAGRVAVPADRAAALVRRAASDGLTAAVGDHPDASAGEPVAGGAPRPFVVLVGPRAASRYVAALDSEVSTRAARLYARLRATGQAFTTPYDGAGGIEARIEALARAEGHTVACVWWDDHGILLELSRLDTPRRL